MDVTGGAVPAYLHVLPSLAGAIQFASNTKAVALRIQLVPHARQVTYRGPQGTYDPAKFPGAQVARWIWEEPGLIFQEWALLDEDAVESWTDDPALIGAELQRDLERLRSGEYEPADMCFYMEIERASQVAYGELVARHVGLRAPDDREEVREALAREGTRRIGAEYSTPLSTLVFLDPDIYPHIDGLASCEGPARSMLWVDAAGIWGRHDDLVADAVRALMERLSGGHTPAGPLVLEYVRPRHRATPKDSLQLRVGAPVREESGEPLPAPLPTQLEHRGRWLSLEDTLGPLLDAHPEPARLRQRFLAFRGARAPDSRVQIELSTEE